MKKNIDTSFFKKNIAFGVQFPFLTKYTYFRSLKHCVGSGYMVGAELSHIEIQFNHETCDGRSTRSRRFFPLSLVCSSSSFIFFVLYQEMRCYLRMNTAESLCIGKIFSTSCCRIGLCPNRKFKSLTLQTIFFEKENQLKNLRQKIYVKNFFTA